MSSPCCVYHEYSYTKRKIFSFWWNFCHWHRWKMSFWQSHVSLITSISLNWRQKHGFCIALFCSSYDNNVWWVCVEYLSIFFSVTLQPCSSGTISWTLKRQCCHFDEIFVSGCTRGFHFDKFVCSQLWKFRQNDHIFVFVALGFCGKECRSKIGSNLMTSYQNAANIIFPTNCWLFGAKPLSEPIIA